MKLLILNKGKGILCHTFLGQSFLFVGLETVLVDFQEQKQGLHIAEFNQVYCTVVFKSVFSEEKNNTWMFVDLL